MKRSPSLCESHRDRLASRPLLTGGEVWSGWAVASILLLALIWRLWGITTTEVWRDEAVTLLHTRAPWWDLLTKLAWVEDTPPLSFLVFKAWSVLFTREWAMRLLPVLTGVATVGVLMKLAAGIHPRAWWPVGLLAAFSHVPVHFSQELRAYSLLSLMTVLCLWSADCAARRPPTGRRMIALAALGALAAHCHASGIFVYAMALVYWAARGWSRPSLGWAFLAGPALWLVLSSPMIWFDFHWAAVHAGSGRWSLHSVNLQGTREILESFFGMRVVSSWANAHPAGGAMWAAFAIERVLMIAPAGLTAAALWDRRLRRPALALALSAAAYVTMLIVSSLGAVPSIMTRTLLPAWWPILLCMGLGAVASVHRLLRWLPGSAVVTLATVYAATWVWNLYEGFPRRPVSKPVFAYLDQHLEPDDLIISLPAMYEDLTIYRLGHSLGAGQLVCPDKPVYAGTPPVHMMVRREPDPQWLDRLRAAEQPRRLAAAGYRVWVLRHAVAGRPFKSEELDDAFRAAHRQVQTPEYQEDWAIMLTCYVPEGTPVSGPSRSGPSCRYNPGAETNRGLP